MTSRRWFAQFLVGLCLFSWPLLSKAALSPYQVVITDSSAEAKSWFEFDFTTSQDIPLDSTISFDFSDRFTLPNASFDAKDNISLTVNNVGQTVATKATASAWGAEQTASGFRLTVPTAGVIAAPAVFVVSVGSGKRFTNPADPGVYAVSTGIDQADGTAIEHAASWIAITESVSAGIEHAEGQKTDFPGGDDAGGGFLGNAESSNAANTQSTETSGSASLDLNNDGQVDFLDVDAFILFWGTKEIAKGDLNHDGELTIQDLAILMSRLPGTVYLSTRFPIGAPLKEDCAILYFERLTELQSAFLRETSTSPLTISSQVGQTISLVLKISTGPTPVGAVDVGLTYDEALAKLTQIYTDESVLTSWINKPRIDERPLRLIAGIPGGFRGSGAPLMVMDFLLTAPGTLTTDFTDDTSVAYTDTNGGCASTRANTMEIMANEPTASGTEPPALSETPVSPIITSSSHPDEQTWYAINDVHLSWDKGSSFSYLFDHSLDSQPDTSEETTATSLTLNDVADGEWVFHLRPLCDLCRADLTVSRRVKIDTTPPAPFVIKKSSLTLLGANTSLLSFTTSDVASGVAYYQVSVAGWSSTMTSGPAVLPPLSPGWYLVSVVAVDKAGNQQTATTRVTIEGETLSAPKLRDGLLTAVVVVLCALTASVLGRQIKRRRSRRV